MHLLKLAAVTALTIAALTACGSSTATPAGAGATTPASAGATTPASSATAATAAATAGAPSSAAATTAASQGPRLALCSLLTQAELNAATGKTYEAGVSDSDGGCLWNVGKTQVNNGNLIGAAIQGGELATFKSAFPGGADTTVAGKPGYWNGKEGLQSMWVDIGGGRVFTLTFPRSGDLGPADQAIAQALAEIAVGRM